MVYSPLMDFCGVPGSSSCQLAFPFSTACQVGCTSEAETTLFPPLPGLSSSIQPCHLSVGELQVTSAGASVILQDRRTVGKELAWGRSTAFFLREMTGIPAEGLVSQALVKRTLDKALEEDRSAFLGVHRERSWRRLSLSSSAIMRALLICCCMNAASCRVMKL